MSTFGQGAPGVRIRLRDASAVNLVTNPNITAGVVGYASKGELNKIISLTSTAEQDTFLGNGYNNSKFNQGLYAARAIINAGGFVEFVRPYGEEIITDDQNENYNKNQELKTDTYYVQYDYADSAVNSFDIDFLASTRYVEDGLGGNGSREIHTISKTLVENTNVSFDIDANAVGDKVPLFAIMNTDPTAANRAGDRIVINSISGAFSSPDTTVTVITTSPHGYEEGDEVTIANTILYNGTVTITSIPNGNPNSFEYVIAGSDVSGAETTGAVFNNTDTVGSGVDYISIKTVASGKASKKLDYFSIAGTSNVILPTNTGDTFTIANNDNVDYTFELVDSKSGEEVTGSNIEVDIVNDDFTVIVQSTEDFASTDVNTTTDKITIDNSGSEFAPGDVVQFTTTGTLPTGLNLVTDYVINTENAAEVDLFEADGTTSVVLSNQGSGTHTITKVINDSALSVVDGTKFLVNDSITLTSVGTIPVGTLPAGLSNNKDYLVSSVNGNIITITDQGNTVTITDLGTGTFIATNQTAILRNIIKGMKSIGYASASGTRNMFDGNLLSITNNTISLPSGDASKYSVDDYVVFSDSTTYAGTEDVDALFGTGFSSNTPLQIASVDLQNDTIKIKTTGGVIIPVAAVSSSSTMFKITNVSKGVVSSTINDGNKLKVDIIGNLSLKVPESIQDTYTGFVGNIDSNLTSILIPNPASVLYTVDETSGGIVLDSSVGRTFLSLGLAIEDYQDIDFDGNVDRIFTLTSEGESIARMYLFVDYLFGGEEYSFSGTIIPYVHNGLNLEIQQQADAVSNGWSFVLNENISLENAILDPNFDFSQSISNGNISGEFNQIAFNANDPALLNDAIWEYDPRNNNGSATLADAWKLFLDKDVASSDMLVSAGTAISNLFFKGLEEINYNVMDSMLDICEKRKDLFAIFDGVDEPKVDTALRKMVGIGSQGDLSRWGGLFDGRSIFFDSVYTKLNVQIVKSIEVGAIITLNRAANVYWLPPAGYETGRIPAALSSKQKYIRSYNYADDPNSDIARLYDANINPTRVNNQGQFIYGQKTMLKRTTALNRLNVIMLIAGIHKRFADFLDRKVFQLNTPALRTGITAELQAQLELIKSSNPAGLTEGIVICDETNNPSEIIDTNQLIVDIFLQPTRTAEFITLRTTVQRTGDTATITGVTITGG